MADRSEQVDLILSAAVELASPGERTAYIQNACGGDEDLQRQVEELVAAYLNAGNFLESPVPGLPPTLDLVLTESAGTQLGRYKLLQQIGEGGFAVVFMAEQEQPVRRRVAVKIIKPGMDSRQVIARFEAERQALAMMDHSNIAKVLDAGTTASGRPYFVMELVKGTPITEYCDEHRLSIDDRLALFSQVCDAVQHAHQKGIIHRDIKPSNVLVRTEDDKPVVKVIDFGIAKATETRLTDKTLFTEFQQLIGTPAYMSPEQAEGSLDIDTRSDVYSLGVLLYELLSGSPPFDPRELQSKAIAEMQRIIREVEPPAPSARLSTLDIDTRATKAKARGFEPDRLAQRLRGELDWIALRALEKDRNRRYQTAAALADDLERYLTYQPVEARPATHWYRFRKFARRNKGLLAALGAIGTVLVGATILSTSQAVRASRAEEGVRQTLDEVRQERDRANRERNRAREAERSALDTLEAVQYERFKGNFEEHEARSRARTEAAIFSVWSGQADAHAAFCETLLQSAAGTTNAVIAANTARAVLINPNASVPLIRQGAALSRLAAKLEATQWTQALRGLAEYRLGNYEKAEECLKVVSEANDSSCRVQAYAVRAMAAQKLNDLISAKKFLEEAECSYGLGSLFKLGAPFNDSVFEWLLVNEAATKIYGESLVDSNLKSRVVAIQESIIAAHPGDSHHLLELGVIYYWLGEDREHLAICRAMLDRAEQSARPNDLDRAAKGYLMREDATENQELLRRAVAAAYKSFEFGKGYGEYQMFQWCVGLAAYRNGDDEEADSWLTEALKGQQLHVKAPASLYRALTRLRQGRLAEARRDYETAKSLIAPLPDRTKVTDAVTDVNKMIVWIALTEANRAFAAAQGAEYETGH